MNYDIYIACRMNNVDLLRKYDLQNESVYTYSCDGSLNSPLHVALRYESDRIVRYLIYECNVCLQSRNCWGLTPLHLAVGMGGMFFFAHYILDCGRTPEELGLVEEDICGCIPIQAFQSYSWYSTKEGLRLLFKLLERGSPARRLQDDNSGERAFEFLTDFNTTTALLREGMDFPVDLLREFYCHYIVPRYN